MSDREFAIRQFTKIVNDLERRIDSMPPDEAHLLAQDLRELMRLLAYGTE